MSKKNFKSGFESLLGGDIVEKSQQDTPKKVNSEKRATFLVDSEQLELIKAISYWERKLLKTILYEALEKYISEYRNLNGEIKTPK